MPVQTPMVFSGVSSGDMSGNLTSDWFHKNYRHCGGFLKWTGTPTGAFTVELSYDKTNVCRTLAASDFSPALSAPAGSDSTDDFSLTTDAPYARLVYTAASGAGVLVGQFNCMES